MTEFVGKVEIRTDTSTGILGSDLILYDRDGKEKIEVGYYIEEAGGTSPGGVYGIRILNSDGEKVMDQNTLPVYLVVRVPSKFLLLLFVPANLGEP